MNLRTSMGCHCEEHGNHRTREQWCNVRHTNAMTRSLGATSSDFASKGCHRPQVKGWGQWGVPLHNAAAAGRWPLCTPKATRVLQARLWLPLTMRSGTADGNMQAVESQPLRPKLFRDAVPDHRNALDDTLEAFGFGRFQLRLFILWCAQCCRCRYCCCRCCTVNPT